ncbi:Cystine-binding periplasmic protein precursor [Planctomycetes bacterium Pan216]|uniref:Cystine-binding periplasmic protein n=1 Tax=Kolteria novifilia TaxID=2527975 RepID=A0A518B9K7_9BACT|nr:Cystine-binding periplasmic protein precursor [Planctomycetes bacterium Pan216]
MFLLLLLALPLAEADTPAPEGSSTLVVGVFESPPFAFRDSHGDWTGLSVELWRTIANDLGTKYSFKAFARENLIAALEARTVDVGVADFTITPDQERHFDFTHAYFASGLSIATRRGVEGLAETIFVHLSDPIHLYVIATLAVMNIVIGLLIWCCERNHNPQFHGSPYLGIWHGLWWSFVSMTTVGYGDKAPITFLGRMLGMLWILSGIVLISIFTGSMASAITVNRLQPSVRGPEDLPRVRVGAISDSDASQYLVDRQIHHLSYATVSDGLAALEKESIDAFVGDAPLLKYRVAHEHTSRLWVLQHPFEREFFALALPMGSHQREKINRALVNTIHQPDWNLVLYRYLGHGKQ